MAHERNRDVENLVAAAADRTRSARAELAAAAHDLSLPAAHRLTEQQRALAGDILAKLVASIELDLRQQTSQYLPPAGTPAVSDAHDRLAAAGLLRDGALLKLVIRRVEEHRLALIAADGRDVAADAALLETLARNPDAELARRAIAHVVGEARRHDRFREPLLRVDDLPEWLAWRLHWQVAAALRADLLAAAAAPGDVDGSLETAVRQAMAEHREGQGSYARATRLAARLGELGELGDDLLLRALGQGHLALFAAGLGIRAGLGAEAVWQALLDRGRQSLLVLLRAIAMPAATAAAIVERLDEGAPLLRPPGARRALLAAYEAIDRGDAERLLRGWQLDPGFREAIDDLGEAERR